ncbi:hypothetical protein [Actinacidiphila yeochonensis]|uniref:hypothetical protein n=1 Tax=Actinacidiphila yeochonensis TaxID=89050 RepID=UPI000566DD63|nr:hypothetical protein [Actinacidiphila yeochonensis]
MGALVWLLIPLAAAVSAALWGRWAARRRTTGDGASLAGYERFRQAMQATTPPPAGGAGPAPSDGPAPAPASARPVRNADTAPLRRTLPQEGEEDSPRGPVVGPVP